jgi:hypothetical protein
VNLRQAEGAAFEIYRDTVTKALRKNRKLTASQQVEFFNDVIRPEIAKIELAVRRSRKLLIRSIISDVIVASGAVGIGLFSGLLPPAIGTAALGLGSLHYSPKFVRKLIDLSAEPNAAANNKYYFLWKITKSGKKRIF